jgi:hypothetical protein
MNKITTYGFYRAKTKGAVHRWLCVFVLVIALSGITTTLQAQTVSAYSTVITTAKGWTTNSSTGTSSSVNYSQNGCVMGGGSAITINTATVRGTYTGEVGMGGSGRWFDLSLIHI